MLNIFIEQKIDFQNEKIDLTPGVAITYFSDVSTRLNYQNNFFNNLFFYPGMDLGYRVNQNLKLYSNIGYTYRIPTYTDLFYSSPTTLGNENLKLEKALTKEFGLKYLKNNFNLKYVFVSKGRVRYN